MRGFSYYCDFQSQNPFMGVIDAIPLINEKNIPLAGMYIEIKNK